MGKLIKDSCLFTRLNTKTKSEFSDICTKEDLTQSEVLDWLIYKVIKGDVKVIYSVVRSDLGKKIKE